MKRRSVCLTETKIILNLKAPTGNYLVGAGFYSLAKRLNHSLLFSSGSESLPLLYAS